MGDWNSDRDDRLLAALRAAWSALLLALLLAHLRLCLRSAGLLAAEMGIRSMMYLFKDTNARNNLPVLAAVALLSRLTLGLALLLALLLAHLRLHLRGARLLATAMNFVKKMR